MRKRPNSLGLVQRSPERGGAHVVAPHRRVFAAGSTSRPAHRPRARRALDGAAAGLNVVVVVGARAEGVWWARARSQLQWAGELGADPPWGMRAAVAVHLPCSLRYLLRPMTLCVSASAGQFGPKGTVFRYGMLRAQNAKSVLADVFFPINLILVCYRSKKSKFTW